MKKIIAILLLLNSLVYSDFMSSVEGMIKSGIGGEKKVHHFPKVQTVSTISNAGAEDKSSSYIDDIMNSVKEKTGLAKKKSVTKPEKKSTLTTLINTVKETVGVEEKPKETSVFSSIVSTAKSTIGIEEKKTDTLSVDGIKEILLTTVGIAPKDTSVIGTIKSTTSGVFSTAKNTGKSAELVSGISYKGTKLMNKAVKVFSDSPLNIFESKKEKDSSTIGTMLDAGNSMLDLVE